MIIAVPSKNRAGQTTTDKILPSAVFYVPESEVHNYDYINNVVGVPKEIQGITATRNWILKNTDDLRVVFVDDDVRSAGWIRFGERSIKQPQIRDENEWISHFEKMFDVTEDLGYYIWGLKTESASGTYLPFKPFLFKAYVTANCMGIVNTGKYLFDERYKVKEDYEICLRHIRDEGGIFTSRHLYWANDHWDKDGGCKDYRTIGIEREAIRMLAREYPGMISSAKRKANKFTISLNL